MIDIPAIKARLSDPREVARLLGLRIESPLRNGVLCRCPVHNNKSGALRLQVKNGVLKMKCFGCGIYGDAIDLLAAIERDPRRGLERAVELAGGANLEASKNDLTKDAYTVERLPVEAYHELAERILEAGRLDGRSWVREVEAYFAERRLLELARADGWACLPGLKWLLQIAEEVCDGLSAGGNKSDCSDVACPRADALSSSVYHDAQSGSVLVHKGSGGGVSSRSAVSALTPHAMLIRAKLARHNDRGEFVPTWGRWRLVIPWRGPDGRISALQRRRTWKHVPRDENDPEPAKYVLPWSPEWPYGSERIGGGYGQVCFSKRAGLLAVGRMPEPDAVVVGSRENSKKETGQGSRSAKRAGLSRCDVGLGSARVAIVEGAVDALAMRALHPSFAVIGVPGINSWRPEWASLVAHAEVRYALDRGKPRLSDGLVSEDIACARIALDVAQAAWQKSRAGTIGQATCGAPEQVDDPTPTDPSQRGKRALEKSGAFAFSFTDATLDWLLSRYRRGKSLFCVLCGASEPWLCRGCGRRRAPEGMDWGEVWRRKAQPAP